MKENGNYQKPWVQNQVFNLQKLYPIGDFSDKGVHILGLFLRDVSERRAQRLQVSYPFGWERAPLEGVPGSCQPYSDHTLAALPSLYAAEIKQKH